MNKYSDDRYMSECCGREPYGEIDAAAPQFGRCGCCLENTGFYREAGVTQPTQVVGGMTDDPK